MAHENSLTLNGQLLFTQGPVASRSIAEFQAGFKIGKATYDDREHAFFLPLDDFSGGIGYRVIDIHEGLGGYWDSATGVDLRRAGHMTLPPLRVNHAMGSSPDVMGFMGDDRGMLSTNINGAADAIICGAGNKIWRSTDGATFTEVATLQGAGPVRQSNRVTTIFDWLNTSTAMPLTALTQAAGTATATSPSAHGLSIGDRVVVQGAVNAGYNGAFIITNIPNIFQFQYAVPGGTPSPDTSTNITYTAPPVRRLYCLNIGADLTSRYWTSNDGITWKEQSRTVWEGVVWDGKIVASMPMPAGSPYGPVGQIVCGFSTDGLSWNIDQISGGLDVLSGGGARPKYQFLGLPHWVGVAAAPWGGTTPYFIDNGFLWALDFYKETAVKIEEVGDKTRLTIGGVFEGYIYVSDGYNVWVYDPGGQQTVRRIGLYNRYGPPPSMAGFTASHFIGGTSTLYLAMVDNANSKYRLLAYSGTGWVPLNPPVTSAVPITGFVNRLPVGQALSLPNRFVDILTDSAQLATTIKIDRYQLPTLGEIPVVGDVPYDTGPDSFLTGWYDGGFIDLQGALHRMYIYAFNVTGTETVLVEYQLDNAAENAAFTTLGTFTANTGTIWFDATNHRGIQFRTVRFRITLQRGGTTTTSPELVALVLVYDKKPEFRSAWTFRIDVNLMVEEQTPVTNSVLSITRAGTVATVTTAYPHQFTGVGTESVTIAGANNANYNGVFTVTGAPTTTTFTYTVGGAPPTPDPSTTITWTAIATLGRVWSFLKTTFDIKTLIPLVIPNFEDAWSPGLNVRIVDMPSSFDDYRTSVQGKGYIELSLLQPVGINA